MGKKRKTKKSRKTRFCSCSKKNPNSISLYFPPKKQTKHQNKSFSIFFWYNTQIKAFSNIFKKKLLSKSWPHHPSKFFDSKHHSPPTTPPLFTICVRGLGIAQFL